MLCKNSQLSHTGNSSAHLPTQFLWFSLWDMGVKSTSRDSDTLSQCSSTRMTGMAIFRNQVLQTWNILPSQPYFSTFCFSWSRRSSQGDAKYYSKNIEDEKQEMKLTTFDKFPSPALTLDGGQVTSTAVDTKDIRSRHYKKTINLLLFFFALVTSCSLPRHRF